MKIKIIEEDDKSSLEYEVNKILSKYSDSSIYGIDYSTHCFESGYFVKTRYTAMIIFK